MEQYKYRIKPINSNFLVDVSRYGVSFFAVSEKNKYIANFQIDAHTYEEEYSYQCNSSNLLNIIKGNEDEIFKRIFIKIDDCPQWSKDILYENRQNQLAEEQRIEEEKRKEEQILEQERQQEERKRQRRLALKRILFPFFK